MNVGYIFDLGRIKTYICDFSISISQNLSFFPYFNSYSSLIYIDHCKYVVFSTDFRLLLGEDSNFLYIDCYLEYHS